MNKYPISERVAAFLKATFTFHPVHDDQPERYTAIRAKALEFGELIAKNTPESAEQTLAFRALQEAVMYANAAIAIHEAADDQNRLPNG